MGNLKLNNERLPVAVERISRIFSSNAEKRICVVDASCVEKSGIEKIVVENI